MVEFKPTSVEVCIQEISKKGSECQIEVNHLEKDFLIRFLGEPKENLEHGIAFLIAENFLSEIERSNVSVFVCNRSLVEKAKSKLEGRSAYCLISCEDAYLGLARLSRFLASQDSFHDWDFSSKSISETAKIGARTKIFPNVTIGPGVTVGEDCVLFPGVVLYPRTQVGNRVRLHANVVLGSDGFGYAKSKTGSEKIYHLGKVCVGDDVEIGTGSTIDRGTIKDTIIENNVKIDNLVQIGHNCHVKSHAILCGQVGLAGGTVVGRAAILAGQVGVADKVEIGDGAIVGPQSGLSKDIGSGEIFMGALPAKPRREWWKLMAYFDRLPEFFDRLKKVEKEIQKKENQT